ncbi:DUF2238 domain-containing protein [Paraferrimonas haliotis]|uniref:Membrane protein n=1 Tax=Paraferrimonas haliotis TaxID=2013866 RepID=A0AA37WWQ8_9GAMM|nr:DUF2238 domain-containing protein [Paraferrimonas haliotis]GLS82654.1 membrane protein [Paraferrimonas haliotis]
MVYRKTPMILWLIVFSAVFLWSAIEPYDRFTWFLEVVPALIVLVIMIATARRFPLTQLLSIGILVHAIVLMVGGHYTYAEVPGFEWLSLDGRNNYDKIGHFMQGFVPALAAREILLRNRVVQGGAWLNYIVISICLAFSAFYELIEWWVAELSGQSAEAFLGTQGYQWDTQSDMAMALVGAICALVLLSRWHDKQLSRLH